MKWFTRGRNPRGALPIDSFPELASGFDEVARLWISDERSFAVVSPNVRQPALFGALLVECIQTAAAAYARLNDCDEKQALAQLWAGFDEERARLAGDIVAGANEQGTS